VRSFNRSGYHRYAKRVQHHSQRQEHSKACPDHHESSGLRKLAKNGNEQEYEDEDEEQVQIIGVPLVRGGVLRVIQHIPYEEERVREVVTSTVLLDHKVRLEGSYFPLGVEAEKDETAGDEHEAGKSQPGAPCAKRMEKARDART